MNVRILCDILAVSTVDARTVRPPMDQVGTEVSCLSCNININAPCCALEKLSKVANGAQGDADGRPDVARADGRLLHVDILSTSRQIRTLSLKSIDQSVNQSRRYSAGSTSSGTGRCRPESATSSTWRMRYSTVCCRCACL